MINPVSGDPNPDNQQREKQREAGIEATDDCRWGRSSALLREFREGHRRQLLIMRQFTPGLQVINR